MKKPKPQNKNFIQIPVKDADEAAMTLFSFGLKAIETKDAGAAFKAFRSCLNVKPTAHQALYNIALLYALMGNKEGAHSSAREALRMDPNNITYAVTAAEHARKFKRPGEAHQLLQRFLSRLDSMSRHQRVLLQSALAVAKYDLGQIDDALALNDATLKLAPTDTNLILNQALINMLKGNWTDWWKVYEATLSYGKNPRMSQLTMAGSWHGARLDGKRLLIISDQGAGDAIQFARYFPDVKERTGASLIFVVQPNCKSVSRLVPCIDEVVGFGERMHLQHDAYSSLLGVMRVLQVSPENCRRPRHIDVNEALTEMWRRTIDSQNPSRLLKIGLVWAGDPRHGNDHARSMELTQFLPFIKGIRGPKARWYSLQVGDAARGQAIELIKTGQLSPIDIVDLGADIRDYADTAAALKSLDVLVSVDTSIVHTSGCTVGGPKTIVLLSHPMEWRWLLAGDGAPWYDEKIVLLRQKIAQDWTSVIDRMEDELASVQ